jgi:signal-transduction protein with cAMP-binding, CBS, and nucleotidyltransferase domain
MKTRFDLVDGMDTVEHVLKSAQFAETKCFIVNRRHENDEYGIVLLSDIAKNVIARDKSPERVNIYEIMTKPVVSVDPEMDIRYCTRLLENYGLSRVPVIEDKKVIGIVGYTHIVLRGLRDKLAGSHDNASH